MKIKIITIGEPKLAYARAGFSEYVGRLKHYYKLDLTHLAEKYADNASKILMTSDGCYKVAMDLNGEQLSSQQLANFLSKMAIESQDLCFIIGGPEGLPREVLERANMRLSLSKLTFPHDLAMVILTESLYRAGTIVAGSPYHK